MAELPPEVDGLIADLNAMCERNFACGFEAAEAYMCVTCRAASMIARFASSVLKV